MLGDVQHSVEAQHVGEQERSERRDLRVGDRTVQRSDVQPQLLLGAPQLAGGRRQHTIDDEARRVAAADRRLANRRREAGRHGHRLRRRLNALDDLHQAHHRGRVEEVEAEHPLGARGRAGQLADRKRRGVRGEDRVSGGGPIQFGEDVLLQFEALRHGLDHEIDVAEAVIGRRRADQRERARELRVRLLAREPLAGDERVEPAGRQLLRPCEPDVHEPLLDVAQDDRDSRGGDHLGDLPAHRSCADDAGLEHEHPQLLAVGCV
jgi:hypothetical protein